MAVDILNDCIFFIDDIEDRFCVRCALSATGNMIEDLPSVFSREFLSDAAHDQLRRRTFFRNERFLPRSDEFF
jgi:hypothetical protein